MLMFRNRISSVEWLTIIALVALGVAGRVMPHAPNFTPVAACALFAGWLFRDRMHAMLVPLLTMAISDCFWLGLHDWRITIAIYAAVASPILMSRWLKERCGTLRITSCATGGAIVFYLTTNLAVWAFGGIYEFNLPGLISCYTAGLAFFKFTLAGDLMWSAGLFGTYALVTKLVRMTECRTGTADVATAR